MTPDERKLLEWLAREDFSTYGECHGAILDKLVGDGLAQIHPFVHQGTNPMYRRVSVTEAGRVALMGRG